MAALGAGRRIGVGVDGDCAGERSGAGKAAPLAGRTVHGFWRWR